MQNNTTLIANVPSLYNKINIDNQKSRLQINNIETKNLINSNISPIYGQINNNSKTFNIQCPESAYVNNLSILTNSNRVKGINIRCSDGTEFYGGTPKKIHLILLI